MANLSAASSESHPKNENDDRESIVDVYGLNF
jgi:hypothetical protein